MVEVLFSMVVVFAAFVIVCFWVRAVDDTKRLSNGKTVPAKRAGSHLWVSETEESLLAGWWLIPLLVSGLCGYDFAMWVIILGGVMSLLHFNAAKKFTDEVNRLYELGRPVHFPTR